MKHYYSLLCFSLIISFSQAYAQPPTIDSMLIDESKSTLTIYGDFGSARGKVWCDSIELPIIDWLNHRIIATLPDTGKGSAGPVVVGGRSLLSKQRMITRWDVDYGTAHLESHSRSVLRDYKKVLFSFRADIHSMLIHKKLIQINTQLMKHSVCEVGYAYLSSSEHGQLPFLEKSFNNDSSFHGDIALSFDTRKGFVWIYDIKGLTTVWHKKWTDSTGRPHDTVIYGKKNGASFGILFQFDSLFQIVHDHYLKGDYAILDSTNVVQVNLYAPPPSEIYADVKSIKTHSYIFPNPAHHKLYLAGTRERPADVSIYNTLGLRVLVNTVMAKDDLYSIDISSLAPGAYWIRIDNEMQKFIIR